MTSRQNLVISYSARSPISPDSFFASAILCVIDPSTQDGVPNTYYGQSLCLILTEKTVILLLLLAFHYRDGTASLLLVPAVL
jgi:hypothetical protein